MVHGAWCMVLGAWYKVHGTRYMVHGAWHKVHDAWSMVHGAWCMVLPPDLRVPGAKHDGEPGPDGHLRQVGLQGRVQLEGQLQGGPFD